MRISSFTSREFNRDTGKAKKAAIRGPVFITNRGRPAYVLLAFEEYQRITDRHENIVELLSMPDSADIEFEPTPISDRLYEPADLD
ncbi:type II toxin-antitoxin system Phd/YefM family antitoxin [Salinisphaera aquimarina]|uniref:Antitoxin n=1 Tax=Salinisphaera aquimarina TaxID=2094031 RepID=A0ABV7EWI1_9GAMM